MLLVKRNSVMREWEKMGEFKQKVLAFCPKMLYIFIK